MSTSERILTIRILDKAAKHPMYAMALGIECVQERIGLDDLAKPLKLPNRAVKKLIN